MLSRPVLFCLAAVGVITLMNGGIKTLTTGYGTLEVAFYRYVSGGSWALLIALWQRPGWPQREVVGAQVLRGVLGTISGTTFFFALKHLSLADSFTISFLAPLFVVILGFLFLKEVPRPRDLVALVLGFAGMIVIVSSLDRSGGGGSLAGALAAVVSAITYAMSLIMLRSLAQKVPFIHIVLFQHWVSALLLLPFVVTTVPLPAAADWPVVLIAPLLGVAGHILFANAYAAAPAARLAPAEYSALIYALAIDALWFGVLPTSATLVGATAIIVAASLAARR